MAGADPNGQVHWLMHRLAEHLGQALAGVRFNALHAQNHGLAAQIQPVQLAAQVPKLLGTDGNNHHTPPGNGFFKVLLQQQIVRQCLILVPAFRLQLCKPAGPFPPPQHHLVAGAVIAGQKRAPAAAAKYRDLHACSPSLLYGRKPPVSSLVRAVRHPARRAFRQKPACF